ncbi:FAD-dependent monooxygenase [Sulfitobacter sp. D35]|uniref:FAD-dependent monooxygenase n=1 Tax=Sulfitobacter sp. D35 TaxID=3083252 RepID=UPI00296EB8CB|nr:FAD-dependent monooxygenase [Sulfitobacter sp. D35]MDW4500056.1 FAD-dependent monooxygenase [Sulfitobacter sp. D35]
MQFFLEGFRPGDPDVCPAAPAWRDPGGGLPETVDVLIAGCGPAGLCLAAQLARAPGVRTMIVEPKLGPMEKGQADGINVRSMEMFQAFGFAGKVSRESVWINETTFWSRDPDRPDRIRRVGRVQDVEDGLSEMPHVLINQARVHDMFLDVMRNAPTRLTPDYGLKVADLSVDPLGADFPVTVRLERTGPEKTGEVETLRARYVVGCDGARSAVRRAIGGRLHGDAAHEAWGVMDVLAVSEFPDLRMKAIVQSDHGSMLVLPREGGYLVRLYVALDKLRPDERVAERGLGPEDIIAKARRILHPFPFEAREVVWWSIYEIGHRLTDKFDDVPSNAVDTRTPRVFTAGDACHTHSPKAGQGMNVSMGDTFNLGWKLVSVLTGRADASLLHSYSAERRAAAKGLVDFDHRWSRVVGAREETADADAEMPRFQREFIANGRFTAGLTIRYAPSALIGEDRWQKLAGGFEIGTRFHSAPVVRLADARPMHLGHVIEADARWRIFAFAPDDDTGAPGGAIDRLCAHLADDPASPIRAHTPADEDIDAVIDVRAVFQQGFRDLEHGDMPALLRPSKGCYGLCDYEKVFCADAKSGPDIFDLRAIDRARGCLVIVRPDQHVAHVLPLDAMPELSDFFAGILRKAAPG